MSRMTVYSHFPNETELFRACSTHWAERHPFPDPSQWGRIERPSTRLRIAVLELYGWYGENRGMLGMIFRDVGSVPALGEVMRELWTPYVELKVHTLTSDWRVSPREAASLSALVRWVIDFPSWRSLAESGLSDSEAAGLASRAVTAAFPDP